MPRCLASADGIQIFSDEARSALRAERAGDVWRDVHLGM